ncbi:hypothetical protein [Mesorhizobium sp. B2-8-3]|uniref:hypothetical protein n=1 Tax=Mesorhizobium sp. B2-8-3 TaxID=2589905 RepID=UPI001125EA6C|nr:hypothetical protein [Mesorhizobium sp. B2-8-3]TPJ33652.1 hypothetical protein FJ418_13565 [Mesorhizobium sp. B2-8-3]
MGVSRGNWRQARKTSWNRTDKSPEAVGLRQGFRSGLEEINARHLEAHGVEVRFETLKVPYVVPETRRTYTPDFPLPNGIIVETKGKLEPKDRAKHLFIKLQHPELDIRFVFQRPHDKIVKGSKTTYAMWCDKYGIKWATRVIPVEWLKEPGPTRKPEEVLNG